MTAITYVSQKEMEKQTGLKYALGYSFPKEEKILIRKGLTKKKKKEVMAHEEEHMRKGEEGPLWPLLIAAGASIFGASQQASASKSAARTAAAASERELEFSRESRDLARGDQAPYRAAGVTALDALMSLTGLGGGGGGGQAVSRPLPADYLGGRDAGRGLGGTARVYSRAYGGPMYGRAHGGAMYNVNEMGPENVYSGGAMMRGAGPSTIDNQTGYVQPNIQGRAAGGFLEEQQVVPPTDYVGSMGDEFPAQAQAGPDGFAIENPGGVEGGYNFQTDPGYQFRFGEGQRTLERGAAARGGLLSGGYARKAMRYGQNFASNEFSNVYNRIAGIAGIGQNSATQSGQFAMQGGQQMGQAAGQGGYATAYGQIGAGNAWANAGNQIAQLDWGSAFNKKQQPLGWDEVG